MKDLGIGLENFVVELYKDLGYMQVKRDLRLSKDNGTEHARGQIDVTYKHLFVQRYVECKHRSGNTVAFDDYSKFETTLHTFNIPTYLGEIVTDSYFDQKVILRAKETRIRLIDRDGLIRLDALRKSGSYLPLMVLRFLEEIDAKDLNHAINYAIRRNMPLDKQISDLSKEMA